jgi:hypothetical protein
VLPSDDVHHLTEQSRYLRLSKDKKQRMCHSYKAI